MTEIPEHVASVFASHHFPGKWAYSVRHAHGGDYSHADTRAEAWAKVRRALEHHGYAHQAKADSAEAPKPHA